ncbi:cold shock and DUF1294 domain-containing protein [Noviherbaspirillum sp. UKPF54]|uniref:DUF1294 domain-containing protein n=1 Tax=Noviherbaspirillum sp. UKPF54 TaxID=2601898 RepID=UPI0011B1C1F0|nr:cold shock and DUF1294 domain-containing protein [Noviherbaspirillum sp. UKPF54]QDZ26600.1 DUF1294 domain-containing protein [Noviherbaspirillum sp. UKPF54]
MRFQGTLTKWNDERGFGFIRPDGGRQDVFVNIKSFPKGHDRPTDGARLSFEVVAEKDGKKRATSVTYLRAKDANRSGVSHGNKTYPWPVLSIVTLAGFPVLYLFATWQWGVSWYVLAAYFGLSLAAMFMYWLDKGAAEAGAWRIPEANLLFVAMAGGWPGATLAQQFLRHKSKKTEFRLAHWFVTFFNIGIFIFASLAGLLRFGGA